MSKRLLVLICLFLYSLPIFAKTVVISDLDDTLKKSNSMGKPMEQAYHFLRKVPYFEMRDLFIEMKGEARKADEEIRFHYVSAALAVTFKAQAWISKNHFPAGYSYLKTKETKAPTYEFKYKTIQKIIEQERQTLAVGDSLHVLMFGDNAQVDQIVYSDLKRDMNLDADIFIRDVRCEATYFDSTLPVNKLSGVNYYFSEVELFSLPAFDFISNDLRMRTIESYKKETLVPQYTLKTLERRLVTLLKDKTRAKNEAGKYWKDYYGRF